MSAVAHGLIGRAVATLLLSVSMASQRDARVTASGWNRLRPGWYIHLALIGCTLFVAPISAFFLSGGSARLDAEAQNFYALLLMLVFAAGGLWTLWAGYLRRVEWREETIRVRTPAGVRSFEFGDYVAIRSGFDGSEFHLMTGDGRVFKLSRHFHGSNQLLRALSESFERRDSAPARGGFGRARRD